jgi:two-component system, response regulator PdtaR
MEKIRITVALHNTEAAEKIRTALQRSGYTVGEVCTSGNEAIRRVRMGATDILLINLEMPDMTGLEVATIVGDENLCSVILFVSMDTRALCEDIVEDYDITLFPKPVNMSALQNTIDIVLQGRRRMGRMEKELTELKTGLENRKVIERAKGILMKRKSISEGEAYRRIQKMSMDSRVAMKDIALKIIELSEKSPKGEGA